MTRLSAEAELNKIQESRRNTAGAVRVPALQTAARLSGDSSALLGCTPEALTASAADVAAGHSFGWWGAFDPWRFQSPAGFELGVTFPIHGRPSAVGSPGVNFRAKRRSSKRLTRL